jgi:hypothetical protein
MLDCWFPNRARFAPPPTVLRIWAYADEAVAVASSGQGNTGIPA